ncbi:endonuclease/exonuclease/phosphatase family protein [Nocardioides sp. TF02-7]|uniref:endonuclease/exonuclease/phosphatase family protein n=1 Tax=Nocardioides sp. TF02-7 TaxID=2917724 RepID=UPI001F065C24|nr:endonuclease/exonuclease/phosphatase family protein [Nocardioides sp. TF02-7]UMG93204.1 endonuclease/exonuclease/phosphatase family protein [Nocardioides sp. TF02-7]
MRNLRRSSRAGAVLLVGALALVLSLPAGGNAAPTQPSQARDTEPVATSLRIVTFNTAAGVGPAKAMADLRTVLAQEPDVVALQEMSSWKKRKRVIDQVICGENGVDRGAEVPTTCAYAGWVPIPAVQGGLPILWRKDKFQLMGHDWVLAAPETYVGARGAGPSTMHAKYVVRVRLKDLATGRNIWILNTHFVPTVQKSSGGRNANKRRIALYSKHMTSLASMVAGLRTKGLVFVTGDFNVNYRKDKVARDPVFPLRRARCCGAHADLRLGR